MALRLQIGGFQAWEHDKGHPYGFFHTYDEFSVDGCTYNPRKVHILLPREYKETPEVSYPVIYFNDGHIVFWPDCENGQNWKVAETLSRMQAEGSVSPVIVVAVTPVNRDVEYCWTEGLLDQNNPTGQPFGSATAYADFLADLKRFVDTHYRTVADPSSTAIVGGSHAGLSALTVALARPDCFGIAGCSSPSFWAGIDLREPFYASELIRHFVPVLRSTVGGVHTLRLWVDWGLRWDQDGPEEMVTHQCRALIPYLVGEHGYAVGRDLFFFEDSVGGHDAAAWQYRFSLFLSAFYKPKQETSASTTTTEAAAAR